MMSFNIQTDKIYELLIALLNDHKEKITALIQEKQPPNYQNFVEPLDALQNELSLFWSPIEHLNAVKNSPELREAYTKCLPELSQYHTWLAQNEMLYQRFQQLADSSEFQQLTPAQQKYIQNELRDFRLAGIALPQDKKIIYAQLQQDLSQLCNHFEENILDATDAWSLLIEDKSRLKGLADDIIQLAQHAAEEKQQAGYLFNLQAPSYLAIMSYADDRALRQTFYEAWVTRASDQGPFAGKFDNSQTMFAILQKRHELAQLLGFNNFAEYSLATKMAKSCPEVLTFLNTLASKAKPFAEKDYQDLRAFAKDLGVNDLQVWDLAYYSEKLKQQRFTIDEQALRAYFPIETVVAGLFEVSKRLFNLTIEAVEKVDAWHEDVRFYQIKENGQIIAYFYFDLFARAKKRGGAWMDDAKTRWHLPDGQIQLPVAYLTCNFTPATKTSPALLTHDEVITLFHEFGHGLHHMLTQVDVLGVSGIHGVNWDAVELPSQFFENWCWQEEALAFISKHYQQQNALPAEILKNLLAAKNFQAGLFLVRQLEFALFDFRLHMEFDPTQGPEQIQRILTEVRQQVSVIPVPSYHRFQHSFSHIFAGGYAAGYYSYLWAEVLACDAFSLFEEQGVFNAAAGQRFREHILAKGGSEDAGDLFEAFRGRKPQLEALLKNYGLM